MTLPRYVVPAAPRKLGPIECQQASSTRSAVFVLFPVPDLGVNADGLVQVKVRGLSSRLTGSSS